MSFLTEPPPAPAVTGAARFGHTHSMLRRAQPLAIACAILAIAGCGRSGLLTAVTSDGGADVEPLGSADSGSDSGAPEAAPECNPPTGLVTLASGQNGPGAIGVDAANVYWITGWGDPSGNFAHAVLKVSRCGGPVTTLASEPGLNGLAMAVAGGRVYWYAGDSPTRSGQLLSVPVGGGQVTQLARTTALISMAVDDANAYWTTYAGVAGSGSVMRVSLAGGTPTTLASAQTPGGVAVAAGDVYWADANGASSWGFAGQIFSEPSSGGTPAVIGGYAGIFAILATNSTNVFWVANNHDWTGSNYLEIAAVLTAPLGGGAATTLATADASSQEIGAIAVDDASLYYQLSGQAPPYGIIKVPLNGAPPVTMASGVGAVGIAVDATSIYWTDIAGGSGSVMRLTPK
jgi:hypothetical protein